jgi:aryl-alcohol dehydrogenase-like predicted oxidoreductase
MRTRTLSDGRVSLPVSQLCLGTMYFGYRTPEDVAFAILDRFRDAGGNFLDTANCYGQWHGEAGMSERVIGRWMKSRGVTGQLVVATKVGARTTVPGNPDARHWQGLGSPAIRADADLSRRNLGVDRLDLYYAHIDDRDTRLEETVDAFAGLAERGTVGLLGASNTATWRIERARGLAQRRPAYSCVQQRHTYLPARPGPGEFDVITEELKDLAAAESLTLFAYSPLLGGAYGDPGKPLPAAYDHPTARARLAALHEVAAELDASANQVVLAWLLRSDPPVIPIPGASSVAQLDEILAATELKLDDAQLARLAGAGALGSSPSGSGRPGSRNGLPRSPASSGSKIHQSSSPIPPPASAPSTVSVSQCAAR